MNKTVNIALRVLFTVALCSAIFLTYPLFVALSHLVQKIKLPTYQIPLSSIYNAQFPKPLLYNPFLPSETWHGYLKPHSSKNTLTMIIQSASHQIGKIPAFQIEAFLLHKKMNISITGIYNQQGYSFEAMIREIHWSHFSGIDLNEWRLDGHIFASSNSTIKIVGIIQPSSLFGLFILVHANNETLEINQEPNDFMGDSNSPSQFPRGHQNGTEAIATLVGMAVPIGVVFFAVLSVFIIRCQKTHCNSKGFETFENSQEDNKPSCSNANSMMDMRSEVTRSTIVNNGVPRSATVMSELLAIDEAANPSHKQCDVALLPRDTSCSRKLADLPEMTTSDRVATLFTETEEYSASEAEA